MKNKECTKSYKTAIACSAGQNLCLVVLFALHCMSGLNAQPQIIAHRGYWDKMGAAQNSITSLKNAVSLGVYGSELDVWLAKDDVLVVNHDESYLGVDVESASYDRLSALQLPNGEYMPALKQCINIVKGQQKTKMIGEIKVRDTSNPKPAKMLEREKQTAAAVVALVDGNGLTDMVDYISFSENVCNELIRLNPKHRVAYLGGDRAPKELKAAGYWGLDYNMGVLRNHPEWVKDAKTLGLTVNVWTVNKAEDMQFFIDLGVDYITTDNPQLLVGLLFRESKPRK
jgi:glycerophosphoryl diester phosphodiesterase